MGNNLAACRGCPCNTSKKAGGLGHICNGVTQKEENRCPEWRINELRKLDDEMEEKR